MPSSSHRRPHLLLTNDDGVYSEGLQSWRAALIARGLAVTVIAPTENQSGQARAVSCHGSVPLHVLDETPNELVYGCAGTPVDCVRVGLLSGLLGPVDLVVSGVNHGANLGDDITYSGTAGAALEAALLGGRGLALSQQDDAGDITLLSEAGHTFALADFSAALAEIVAGTAVPAGTALNVNLPCALKEDVVRIVRPGRISYPEVFPVIAERDGDAYDVWPYARPGVPEPEFEFDPQTDYGAIADGVVALSALTPTGAPLDAGQPWLRRIVEPAEEMLRSRDSKAATIQE